MKRGLLAALVWLMLVAPVLAQWQVPQYAVPIGRGTGTGFSSALCTSAQLLVGQSAAAPLCKTITGDVTISAAGATAIGATKVTNAMLNADVFSTAHTWSAAQGLTLTQNAATAWSVVNTSSGTGALALYQWDNGTGAGSVGIGGTGYTGQGGFLANRTYLLSAAGDGISIYAAGAKPIDFYVNGARAGGFTSAGIWTLGTDLAVADGGTGASTASAARGNLGLAVGSDVQAFDADLSAIAGLTSANNKCFYFTGSGTAATYDCSSFGRSVANAADASALRTLAGSVIGTDVQAFDSDLSALAANATNGILARTGSGTASARTMTGTANEITVTNGDGVSGNPTWSLPAALTFTGKTVTGGTYSAMTLDNSNTVTSKDTLFTLQDDGDATKQVRFQLSGITPGNIRTLTMIDASDVIVGRDSGQTLTNKTIDTANNVIKANGNTVTATAGTATVTLPNSTDTIVGRATTDTLTNKSLTSPVVTGTADVQQALVLTGDISPTQLSANTNDWAPTGFSTASTIRLSTDASRNITGLAAGADGRIIIVHNVGSFSAVLTNEDAASTAGNRFLFGGDMTLATNTSVTLRYDATSSRWRAITSPGAGGGGGGTVTSAATAAGNGIAVSGTCTITTSGTCTVATDASFFQNYMSGLTLSTAGASSSFAVAAGVATDGTNAAFMKLTSSLQKNTGAWALGINGGSLDTGSIGNNWYHVFLIRRPDTGVVDVLSSLSATAPTMPTNYTQFRRVGSLKVSGGNYIKFIQTGIDFLWDVSVNDVAAGSLGTTATSVTLTTPPGIRTRAILNAAVSNATAGHGMLISSLDISDQAASGGNMNVGFIQTASQYAVTRIDENTNTSNAVRARASFASSTYYIWTVGWRDISLNAGL